MTVSEPCDVRFSTGFHSVRCQGQEDRWPERQADHLPPWCVPSRASAAHRTQAPSPGPVKRPRPRPPSLEERTPSALPVAHCGQGCFPEREGGNGPEKPLSPKLDRDTGLLAPAAGQRAMTGHQLDTAWQACEHQPGQPGAATQYKAAPGLTVGMRRLCTPQTRTDHSEHVGTPAALSAGRRHRTTRGRAIVLLA